LCLRKSRYAARRLTSQSSFGLAFQRPTFKEFVLRANGGDVSRLISGACEQGFLAGVPLERWYPELADCFLVSVTERRTRDEIDALATCLQELAHTTHA